MSSLPTCGLPIDHLGRMAEVKQRVRSELGELRREPFPHQRIPVVLDGRSEVLHEAVLPQIAFLLGKGRKELLHALRS